MQLWQGDCLELMKNIPDKSIDMILCDLPYGTTQCKWDNVIPFEPLWEQYKRIIRTNNSPIVLFGNEPFTSCLILSNLKGFKYRIDWDKKIPGGMGYAKYRPMSQIEDICIFTIKGDKTVYNPQLKKRDKPLKSGGNNVSAQCYGGFNDIGTKQYKKTYLFKQPTTLISYDKIRNGAIHPTQKPIPLLEYLINTYSNIGDTVLDNCMGSGSTGISCVNTGRNFIGIELDENYFNIAKQRIENARKSLDIHNQV